MFQLLVLLAIAGHGIGHSAGLFLQLPRWFQVAWLAPGVAFLAGTWLLWQRDSRALPVLAGAAIASIALEVLAPDALKPGPGANAFLFNAALLVAIVVPMSRTMLTNL